MLNRRRTQQENKNVWNLFLVACLFLIVFLSWEPSFFSTAVSPSTPPLRPYPYSVDELYKEVRNLQFTKCGPLCDFSHVKWPTMPWDFSVSMLQGMYRKTPVDCDSLFNEEAEMVFESLPIEPVPPKKMPLESDFTLGGRIQVRQMYMQNLYLGGNGHNQTWSTSWSTKSIEENILKLQKREMHGTYGKGPTNFFADIILSPEVDIRGKRVLVIGSEKPWVEVACLLGGAAHVTTLDYGEIHTTHPLLETVVPSKMSRQYREKTLELFDIAITFSSIEHSGLGRYGDRINPWGDLITIAKVSCLVKPKEGRLLIGIPSSPWDILFYNAHRMYGSFRWPLLLTNWYPLSAWKEKKGTYTNGIVFAKNDRI